MRIASIINMIKNIDKKGQELLKLREQRGRTAYGLKDGNYIIRSIEFYLDEENKPYDLKYTNTAAKKPSPKNDAISDFSIDALMELYNLCDEISEDSPNIRRD